MGLEGSQGDRIPRQYLQGGAALCLGAEVRPLEAVARRSGGGGIMYCGSYNFINRAQKGSRSSSQLALETSQNPLETSR